MTTSKYIDKTTQTNNHQAKRLYICFVTWPAGCENRGSVAGHAFQAHQAESAVSMARCLHPCYHEALSDGSRSGPSQAARGAASHAPLASTLQDAAA